MSEVKVNKISPRSGTTVTLGDSGDTFTIPSGATINNQGTATNFGATGSASWTTTVKTNSDSGFTAVAGEGYFLDTSSGTISVNLPAGSAGAVVAFKDYANTFDTNPVTLVQNGSDKIGGSTINGLLQTEGIAVTLVFIDSTQGWLVTDSGLQDEAPTASFVTATGGTVSTVCTNFKVHTFTGPGTFCVSCAGNAAGSNTVSYMVVAGGGGANQVYAAGGGAGGFRESKAASDTYTASPLNATSGPTYNLPVTATGFPITIGAGGGATPTPSCRGITGSNSIFSSITSAGGGGGGAGGNPGPQSNAPGLPGGSGGGAGGYGPGTQTGGAGNTPPVSPPQGQPGGDATTPGQGYASAAGGGATAAGTAFSGTTNPGADTAVGGAGATTSINGTPTAFAGGGGGGVYGPGLPSATTNAGGAGGGGQGTKNGPNPLPAASQNGTANTGGGAGGGGNSAGGYSGGSGIVIIRYKFQ
jgi:hypothetical protein